MKIPRSAVWTGVAAFATVLLIGAAMLRGDDLPLNLGQGIGLVHAAMGIGFFAGFAVALRPLLRRRSRRD